VATQPNEDGEAPGTEELEIETEGQPKPNEAEGGGDEGESAPVALESLAQELGWVPKDQYKGPADAWKPADEFIREGRNIQRNYANELKSLRSTVDTISRTSAQILEDRLEEQRRELTQRFNEQVEEGNATAAFKTSEQLRKLDAQAPQVSNGPAPEAQEFIERHSAWFGKDRAATVRAQEICDNLAAKGVPVADQLRAAERTVRLEYPEHFAGQMNGSGQPQRNAPTVNRPGSRSNSGRSGGKTFNDMPREAQDTARRMVENGHLASTDAYAKMYWQNAERKQ
jgi:hypothetical protein